MKVKGSGKINEIIYNNTAYYNGKYRYFRKNMFFIFCFK